MSNIRSFKPKSARSARRRYDRALGKIGVNAKPTPRARTAITVLYEKTSEAGSNRRCPRCERENVVLCSACRGWVYPVDLSDRDEIELAALVATLSERLGGEPLVLDGLGCCECPKSEGQPLPAVPVISVLDHTWACRLRKDPKPITQPTVAQKIALPEYPTPGPEMRAVKRHVRGKVRRVLEPVPPKPQPGVVYRGASLNRSENV